MRLITAIIREDKLDAVREALIEAEITRITVSRVSGHGRQETIEIYRGKKVIPNLIPKIRIDIAVNDAFVDITVNAILNSAKSGQVGDGKIFITPLEECIRIRTEERGGTAI
ncbi:MAG: P-II family nitrogen regulator [Calditrichaeota bacterium]|nr:MAG: P-II family nitrogen regulator [Calditrichota bacterium]